MKIAVILVLPALMLAQGGSAGLRERVEKVVADGKARKTIAVEWEGERYLTAIESAEPPEIYINDESQGPMRRVGGTNLWFHTGSLKTGRSHAFQMFVAGKAVTSRVDVAAFGPEAFEQPGVPQGKLSEKLIHTSKIYDGMKSDYWIYVPAQYDASKPAALMVWQDGEGHVNRNGGARTLNTIDNLIHQKRIPVMIQVFISPGLIGERRMRSIQYDTVNDTYARFLRDEILAEIQAKYNIRRDAYSRGIAGNSSGGICSFNVAWFQPDQFSRVLSRIGSFTSIQWHPGELDGGNVYPFKIRKEAKRNIRVWLQDGSEDLENNHGSWPLQNIQMANSLKLRGYDFHFSFGNGAHNGAQPNAEAPEALTWLWRDYDASKTGQNYEMEEAEKSKPYFRVKIANR